jgi:hypothetical protein
MELAFREGRPFYDSQELAGDHGNWGAKPGNKKRIGHLTRALAENNGFVDAVIVTGEPGKGYRDALPWFPHQRQNSKWRILTFDSETGHFSTAPQAQLEHDEKQ